MIILTFAIAVPSQLFAQSISGRSSLSLSIGPSKPVGDFSKTDANNSSSGYAKTGETVKLSFDYKLTNIIGLEAMVYGQRNALNTSEYEKQLEQTYFFQDQEIIPIGKLKRKAG